jgi:hypothetical protein
MTFDETTSTSPSHASSTAPVTYRVGRTAWTIWLTVTLGTIWLAVALISVFAPDMVSGSEQQHLPIAALTTWVWGTIATVAQGVFGASAAQSNRISVWLLAQPAVTTVAWCIAVIAGVFTPPMRTGTDPTIIPLAALIAPIAACAVTVITATLAFVTDRATR